MARNACPREGGERAIQAGIGHIRRASFETDASHPPQDEARGGWVASSRMRGSSRAMTQGVG